VIIVSITAPGLKNALAQLRGSQRYADMIELRLDLIGPRHLSALLRACRRPAVVTCRPRWEGGMFDGPETQRIGILREALLSGAAFIDIELTAFPRIRGTRNAIVSAHFFGGRPGNVQSLYRRMRATGAYVLKFAFAATDAWENAEAWSFLELAGADGQKAIAIAMGEAGEPSRVLYRKFGGWATYAAAEGGPAAAPGQVTARTMKRIYRSAALNGETRVFGVIGNPVRQSKGISVHNALFRHDRLNSVYVRFPVIDLGRFMKRIAPRLNGFSVTVPHKEHVMRFLHGASEIATAVRAANTVLVKGKRFIGENTDAAGALDAIEARFKVRNRQMLILGAGGAARAIAHEAGKRGCAVTITNRTEAKARSLARATRSRAIAWNEIPEHHFDILVNATSAGMVPHVTQSPLPRALITSPVVFDVVYNPPLTTFLRDARMNGAEIVPGTEMYINQAARQYRLYARRIPSQLLMKRAMRGDV
jgi:3-dehydroquinate dehydratase / shikimate dehydrogenase